MRILQKHNTIRWIAACLLALASQTGYAQSTPVEPALEQRLERLAEQLEQQRRDLHIPGLAIAVVKHDSVVFARGFGVKNVQTQEPVTVETLFAVGSTTKAFTATLVGMLVDEGKMDWDDPLATYLPDLELNIDTGEEQVTIRDLLSHRTGFGRMGLLWSANRFSRRDVLRAAANAEPLAGFREKFLYSNVMYLAAGVAAAKAADTDWDTLLAGRIFKPLGMESSNTSVRESQKDPRLATGYIWDREKQAYERQQMRVLDAIGPAGAINSNVRDMARWVRFQLGRGAFGGKRLIGPRQLIQTWTKQVDIGSSIGYGLGWMQREWNGKRVVEHGGAIDGFSAEVALLPEANVGFVLLTNVTHTPLQATSIHLVFNALLGAWDDGESALEKSDLEPYIGEYNANFGPFRDAEFTVRIKNGKLTLDVPGQTVYELKPPDAHGKWRFVLTDGIAVSFKHNESGAVLSMTVYQAGYEFELPRVGLELPAEVPLDQLQKYLGAYHSDEKNKTLKILIQNNRLAVDVPGQPVYELSPPDGEGRWAMRIKKDKIQVKFTEAEDGSIQSMTLFQDEKTYDLYPVSDKPERDLPSLENLLALVHQGHGADNLKSIRTLRMSGTVHFIHQGVRGAVTILTAGTDRYSIHMDLAEFGHIETAIDGHRGWTESTFHPFRELTGRHLAHARLQHPLWVLGGWRDDFDSVKILRSSTIDDKEGVPTRFYVDVFCLCCIGIVKEFIIGISNLFILIPESIPSF